MPDSLTDLLNRWRAGEADAERAALDVVYPVLRALAHRQMPAQGGWTLQPTELAHEAYLKLAQQQRVHWQDRGHFYAIAARVVRRVVIDHLRERDALKRGGLAVKIPLDLLSESDAPAAGTDTDWLQLDRVLDELESFDPQGARLVEMRYFTGLPVTEIAAVWQVSEATVARQWRATRAWLQQRLDDVSP